MMDYKKLASEILNKYWDWGSDTDMIPVWNDIPIGGTDYFAGETNPECIDALADFIKRYIELQEAR